MPIDDTGDATEVQAPDVAPEPETALVTRRPASGDGLLAAGLSQFIQNLNNQITWLKKPFAKALAWVGHILAFRNARQHTGHVFNHQGILDGRILTVEEDWIDIGGTTKGIAPANGSWFGRWNFGIFGQGGNVFASQPALNLAIAPWGPRAAVTIIGGLTPFAQSAALVEMCRGFMLGGSSYICLETSVSVNPNGLGTLDTADTYSIGFSAGTLVAGADVGACNTGAMVSNAGAYLVKLTGASNWTVLTRAAGGGGSSATTIAVAADTPVRYRVEIMRAATSDDGTNARVIHYVNGVEVANHLFDMVGVMLTPFFRTSGQYSGPNVHSVFNVGRIRLTARLELGDVYP